MTNWKAIVFGLVFVAAATFASASCWDVQQMQNGLWTWSAWTCNSTQVVGYFCNIYGQSGPFSMMLHGQIVTTAPSGHPEAGQTYKVYLQGFQYSGMYPATLKCYKQMGVPGNYWWMYTGQTVTLTGGQFTSSSSAWVLAGCPPIKNGNQQGGSPPQVRIDVAWDGFGGKSKR
ncbi:MAG: hypothetical protein V1881_03380 [Candidatus Micrarchaeota archaeon]